MSVSQQPVRQRQCVYPLCGVLLCCTVWHYVMLLPCNVIQCVLFCLNISMSQRQSLQTLLRPKAAKYVSFTQMTENHTQKMIVWFFWNDTVWLDRCFEGKYNLNKNNKTPTHRLAYCRNIYSFTAFLSYIWWRWNRSVTGHSY